tara:strand:+ start:1545 stop:1781 length:237 start_codon:yes stop_codon:yes gene_type:complete
MDSSVFVTAGAVSIIYLLIKFFEMRIIIKENKPLKLLFRDSLIVYFSVVGGIFIIEQLQPLNGLLNEKVGAFTNEPNF